MTLVYMYSETCQNSNEDRESFISGVVSILASVPFLIPTKESARTAWLALT